MTPAWLAWVCLCAGLLTGVLYGAVWGMGEKAAAFSRGYDAAVATWKKCLEEERAIHARQQRLLVAMPPPNPLAQALRALPVDPMTLPYRCAHGLLPEPCKICAPWLKGIADMPEAKQ